MLCLSAHLPMGTWMVCTFQLLGLYIYTHRWFKSPLLPLGYTLRRRVAWSCGISRSNLLRNCRTAVHGQLLFCKGALTGWEACPSVHVPGAGQPPHSRQRCVATAQTPWAAEPERFALSCHRKSANPALRHFLVQPTALQPSTQGRGHGQRDGSKSQGAFRRRG